MTIRASGAELRSLIEEVLYRGTIHLDDLEFGAWLDLALPEFRYRIEAYSPEIRKPMLWLDHDRTSLAALIELLPKHHVNGARWHRHVVLYTVNPVADGEVEAVSSLAVFHTALDIGDSHVDGGSSNLFAVGRYHDRFRLQRGHWRLAERTVKLETRQLGIGSHLFP